jgi:hypothetical protein
MPCLHVGPPFPPPAIRHLVCALLAGTWMVALAALISSTLINCIFPFFTYVESSGMLGEFLPQVRPKRLEQDGWRPGGGGGGVCVTLVMCSSGGAREGARPLCQEEGIAHLSHLVCLLSSCSGSSSYCCLPAPGGA